jgi:WD40 repeat protein
VLKFDVLAFAFHIPGSKNGSAVGWDLRSLKKAFEVFHPHPPSDVTCVASHPTQPSAAVGYCNGDVALFDVRGLGSLFHVMPLHTDQCRSVQFSPNGAYVATAAFDCSVVIAEAASLAPTKVMTYCVIFISNLPTDLLRSNCMLTETRWCRRTGILPCRCCSLAVSTRV